MKTRLINFGSGLVTGLCLFTLLSASVDSGVSGSESEVLTTEPSKNIAANTAYVEVPIAEFFGDVARFNRQYARRIRRVIPEESGNSLPSRMFIYSLKALEDFFTVVK